MRRRLDQTGWRRTRLFWVLVVVTSAAGCNADRTASPRHPAPSPLARLAAPRNAASTVDHAEHRCAQQSATGGYSYFGMTTGNNFKYEISAIRHPDCSVSGEVNERVELAATGALVRTSHGDVTCLTIEGNRARLAYRFDRYEGLPPRPVDANGNFITTHGIIVVVDNGEGSNAVPDSAANNPGSVTQTRAQLFCDVGFPRPIRQIEKGNIQVRP